MICDIIFFNFSLIMSIVDCEEIPTIRSVISHQDITNDDDDSIDSFACDGEDEASTVPEKDDVENTICDEVMDVESPSTTENEGEHTEAEKDVAEVDNDDEDDVELLGACAPESTTDIDFQELVALRASSACQSGMSEFDLNEVKSQVIYKFVYSFYFFVVYILNLWLV